MVYGAFRKDVIQGASDLREAMMKYVEENTEQLEYGDLTSDVLSGILC